MSPKAKKTAAPAKEIKAPKATAGKKGAKAAIVEETIVAAAPAEGAEEEIDEDEVAASSSSGGGNAAALAAVTGTGEMSASLKNFRHHPDMENFYRFIYENDLRLEALAIIDEMMVQRMNRKNLKAAKNAPH